MRLSFDIPFPPQVSPDLDWARTQSLKWTMDQGLLRSEAGRREFESWDLAQLSALAFPHARGDDLVKVINFFAVGFLFDDQFDPSVPGRFQQMSDVAKEMIVIPYRPPSAPVQLRCPLTLAWQKVWQQMVEETSEDWQLRFASDFARWLAAHMCEVPAHESNVDITGFLELRRQTVGILLSLDLTEWTGRFVVPVQVIAHPWMRALRYAAVDTIAFMNDIHSVEREEARCDPHNFVIVLQRHKQCSRAEAIHQIERMAIDELATFVRLQNELPQICSQLRLTDAERSAVEQSVEGARTWIRGNCDWALMSPRYAVPDSARVTYVDDLLVPAV